MCPSKNEAPFYDDIYLIKDADQIHTLILAKDYTRILIWSYFIIQSGFDLTS